MINCWYKRMASEIPTNMRNPINYFFTGFKVLLLDSGEYLVLWLSDGYHKLLRFLPIKILILT